jgi:hypothetical protein
MPKVTIDVPEGFEGAVSMDRIAVPMEEPRKRPVGRPRKGAPKRPVSRAWRMAYTGCLTLHDAKREVRVRRAPGPYRVELACSLQ